MVGSSGVRVSDGGMTAAHLTHADLLATNGVLHIIDAVLLPAALKAELDAVTSAPQGTLTPLIASTQSIPTLASSRPELSTLVSMLSAAGLIDELSSGGQLTVFAPTNDAFAKLPEALVAFLRKPENKQTLVHDCCFSAAVIGSDGGIIWAVVFCRRRYCGIMWLEIDW